MASLRSPLMHGFLFIDKPKNLTSFDVVARVRKITGVRRVGHAGTLDPLATGLLIVGVGEATKLLEYLVGLDKEYVTIIQLGGISDTYDAMGDIEYVECPCEPSKALVNNILQKEFIGEMEQVPPMYSAIKVKGKKAYELARKGIREELKPRLITIYNIRTIRYEWPELEILVHCSSGTYIRSLAFDVGQKLGCGGFVQELRRIKVGDFDVKNAATLETLEKGGIQRFLLPLDIAVKDFPKFEINKLEFQKLAYGQKIPFPEHLMNLRQQLFALFFEGKLVGIGECIDKNFLKFRKKLNVF